MVSYVNVFGGTAIQPTDVSFKHIELTENITLAWPITYGTLDNVVARLMDVDAQGTYSITMPPANQVSVGESVIFKNIGSYTCNILKNDSSTIISIGAGEAFYIYVTDNTTEAGVWGITQYGTGTSSADAASLAGFGLKADGSKLQTNTVVDIKSSNFSIASTDRAKLFVWQGGIASISVPTLPSGFYFSCNNNSAAGSLTFNPGVSHTINGFTTFTLGTDETATFITDGNNWFTLGYGKSTYFNIGVLNKDVSGNSNITLSQAEAQNLIHKFTGTLTGNIVVYYPAVNYNTYIQNDTSGAFSLSVQLFSGGPIGSPLSVSQGARIITYSDGTGFYPIPTELAEGTAFQDGTVSDPSIKFLNDGTTGFYRIGDGNIGVSSQTTPILSMSAEGINSSVGFQEKENSIYAIMLAMK